MRLHFIFSIHFFFLIYRHRSSPNPKLKNLYVVVWLLHLQSCWVRRGSVWAWVFMWFTQSGLRRAWPFTDLPKPSGNDLCQWWTLASLLQARPQRPKHSATCYFPGMKISGGKTTKKQSVSKTFSVLISWRCFYQVSVSGVCWTVSCPETGLVLGLRCRIAAAEGEKHEITQRNSSLELLSLGEAVRLAVWCRARNTKAKREQRPLLFLFLFFFMSPRFC